MKDVSLPRPVIVFIGGGLGACLRALFLAWLAPWGGVLPVPVLLVNILGAFVLGLVYVLADEAGLLRADTRLFLAVGLLGGFTTFSTFGWGAATLLGQGGHWGVAALYLAVSVVGGVLSIRVALTVGRVAVLALERGAVGVLGRLDARGLRRTGTAHEDIATIEAEDREESA